jgi:hypothetical protein
MPHPGGMRHGHDNGAHPWPMSEKAYEPGRLGQDAGTVEDA